ncbi:MAG TPA: hypothetical protein VJ966_12320 [Actinomycetes bacterium]|nr:hypothetical protein [Actinomycetes bacterium]
MRDGPPAEAPARYEILVGAELDDRWSAWFEGLEITRVDPGRSLIAGTVPDQAALHGLLTRVRDLNLPLLSVRRVQP